MSCCKKDIDSCDNNHGNDNWNGNYFFIVLILFILLAIIWGGSYIY